MQQGRVSTIRFNEWICICAQYEKAVARLGRQVYQGYSRGLITDYAAIELCKEISQAFADSKKIRADLEEELERDALHGLNVEESARAEEVLELSSSQKAMRRLKLTLTRLMGRQAVNRSLQSYRDKVRELSRDLGLRALAAHTKEPLLKMEGHLRLCNLAIKLDEESNKKWEEITAGKNAKGQMDLSFHTMLISFVANFANFSRGTAFGKMVMKMMKYDSKEEEKKLTKQFEGSKTAEALEAQMSEVEEPDLDIGREMASMEREYKETPTDWALPPKEVAESWVPDTADSWAPDLAQEAAPPPPASTRPAAPEKPAKPALGKRSGDGPKPQVLRQRPQAEPLKGAEAWVAGSPERAPEAESWAPPAAPAPRIGQTAPTTSQEAVEDWASEGLEEEPLEPSPAAPRLGGAQPLPASPSSTPTLHDMPPVSVPPIRQSSTPTLQERPPSSTPTLQSLGPGTAPPGPAAAPPSLPGPAAEAGGAASAPGSGRPQGPPARANAAEPPLPPLPPLPSRPIRSLDAAPGATPAAKPPGPAARPAARQPQATPPADDPLLRLLRPDPSPEPKSDDDLLPAFLRERNDDDSSEPAAFIPDLPDSVDSGLKILPFGSGTTPKKPDDSPDSFIPEMPE
jgi:hypothetical protein